MTSSQVLQERAETEQQVAGKTLCDCLSAAADQWGGEPALSDREPPAPGEPPARWQTLTWAQVRQEVLALAAGLVALGLQPGERAALMLPNRAEHVLADLAVVHAGGVPVTLYATFAPDQIAYVAGDCDARIAVLDGEPELARWEGVLPRLPGLTRIIVRDAAACPGGGRYLSWASLAELGHQRHAADPGTVASRIAAIKPADPLTLLYTSGTTGNPKGVLLTHHNVLYQMAVAQATGTVHHGVRWVSYLPIAHIAERMFSIYLPLITAGHVHFCHDTSQLVSVVTAVKPTSFFGVPRVWEKFRAAIQSLMALEQDPAKRAATERAMAVGRRYIASRQYGQHTPPALEAEFRQAEQEVLAPIRSLLGLGEAAVVSSAAAPLPTDVADFFAGLGMMILDIYGMTETTGALTANTKDAFRFGTVGRPLKGVELKIAGDGEILARSPLSTPGYLNQPGQTAELIDADGWLHTGDIGALDEDGFLAVVDRKKELIITAGGENVSPAAVENLLTAHPLIGQALAFGDRRPYLVALLTLDPEAAPAWARSHGIESQSLAELASHPAVLAEASAAVAAANERLARVQQVKRWRLLPVEWAPGSGELTPTLKLKRRVVHAKYADDIDALYAG